MKKCEYTDKNGIILLLIIIISYTRAKRDGKIWLWSGLTKRKAYNLVPQSWIIRCLNMYKIFCEVIKVFKETRENWRVELATGGKKFS